MDDSFLCTAFDKIQSFGGLYLSAEGGVFLADGVCGCAGGGQPVHRLFSAVARHQVFAHHRTPVQIDTGGTCRCGGFIGYPAAAAATRRGLPGEAVHCTAGHTGGIWLSRCACVCTAGAVLFFAEFCAGGNSGGYVVFPGTQWTVCEKQRHLF